MLAQSLPRLPLLAASDFKLLAAETQACSSFAAYHDGPRARGPAGGQAADQRLNVLGRTVIEPGLSMLGPQPAQSSARSESESAALTVLLRYYTAVLQD